ncbi:MAG TPA: cardiolipin synthase [Anaerovoracaceae bacterium]|nr:cardiolipin synthase [Anaerovoracaceae bacterium]
MLTIEWAGLLNIPVVIYAINFVIAFVIIFLERKNPAASLAWIMVLFMLPGAGIFLYLLLSQNISRQRIFKLSNYEASVIDSALNDQIKDINDGNYNFTNREAEKWYDMILLHLRYSGSFYSQDNGISVYTEGQDKFDAFFKDISEAKYSIHVMYYIVKKDRMGYALIDILTEKAKQGLEVRLLIDALGGRQISRRMLRDFEKAGGKFAFFFPPRLKYLTMKLNYRNHRKLVVIDGKIGYLGGFNVADEYMGRSKKFGNWRDTHLRLTGSCVQDMNARFLLDWRSASKEPLMLASAFFYEIIEEGTSGIQIVSCGPDSGRSEIKRGYLKMISSAKKNIYIQTPYFVPDASIIESLKNAISSGVDVRIMIPCMPDHMFVYWATYSYVGDLLRHGARIFIYTNGFLHAKNICVDGEVASVGSANFDIRSFNLNFEVNAFIYDSKEVINLEQIFERDMEQSEELTWEKYCNRSLTIKFKESISRLLSDLL